LNKTENHLSGGGHSERTLTARNFRNTAGDTGQSGNFQNHILIGNSGKGQQFALTRGDTGGVIFSRKDSGNEESNQIRISQDVGTASIQFRRNSKNGGSDHLQASFGEQSDSITLLEEERTFEGSYQQPEILQKSKASKNKKKEALDFPDEEMDEQDRKSR